MFNIHHTFSTLFFAALFIISTPSLATSASELSGIYSGSYNITMRAAPTGAILGTGVKKAEWVWDFDNQTAVIAGTTLSVGFNYALHDIDNADAELDTLYFDNNGDGTYRLYYAFQIYHPGLGNPMANTSTTFRITEVNNQLQIEAIDAEQGPLDNIIGTQIVGVFPLTIEPDLHGFAYKDGVDSNNDGITDKQAIALGLDPNSDDNDHDGILDHIEIGENVDNPLDSDNDGIINALEYGDNANHAHTGQGLRLISDDFVTLQADPTWSFSAIKSGNMHHQVDNLDSIEDIINTDSTLGDPGLDYNLGNISFTLKPNSNDTTSEHSKITLTFSTELPKKTTHL